MAKKLYQVQSGDSLIKIAQNLLGDKSRWQELAYINSLSHPYIITPGQILLLPADDSPIEVLVTKGQTAPPTGPPAPDRTPPATAGDPFMAWFTVAAFAVGVYLLASGKG